MLILKIYDMRNGLFLLLFLLCACGDAKVDKQSEAAKVDPAPAKEALSQDALIQKLSSALSSDTGRVAAEQNTIVNHAIDQSLDLEVTRSGLFYQIETPGDGPRLKWADYVKVHYKGSFLDGRVFDSSYKRGEPIQFYVGNMITAWNEGLQLLSPGAKARFITPSHLAYGEKGFLIGQGDTLVPAHTILVFDLEVIELLPDPNG